MTVVQLSDLPSLIGQTLGPSASVEITQDRVNLFAELPTATSRCRS